MKSLLWLSGLPLAVWASAIPEPTVDYNGFKILRVDVPEDSLEVEAQLKDIAANVLDPGRNGHFDLVVAPEDIEKVNALVLNSTVLSEDIGAEIAGEETASTYAVPSLDWFNTYHSYADHTTFLKDLQTSYPARSKLVTTGTSVENRAINGIHIWGSGSGGSKPAILIHGTVHAREWATTMATEYFAYQLLTAYGSNTAVTAALNKFDVYVFPVVNPDGFVYSQTSDRLWRKNRQRRSSSSCIGTDLNRNWPYKWDTPGGSSTNPCAQDYRGLAQGDTPEMKGFVAFANQLRSGPGIRLFLDIHTYGQYILWPFGYSCSATAPNDAAHNSIATAARSAISALYGTSYTIGPACKTLYATSGSSDDYHLAAAGATYAYTYELRDTGRYGFSLPANQIKPTSEETWAGVLAMLGRV